MKPNSLFKGKHTKKALFIFVPIILVCILLALSDRNAQTEKVSDGGIPGILSSERGDKEDMEKLYERINFENTPSTKTPLNEENLNKIDSAIDNLDDRVIQISEEMENPVELEETAFSVCGKNIVNQNADDVIKGGYTTDGVTITTSPTITQSGLCKVKPNTSYVTNYPEGGVVWYNASRTFLSYSHSSNFSNNCITSPVNAYYARFLSTTEHFSTFIVCEGTEIPEYEPYTSYIPRQYLDIPDASVEPKDTTFFIISKNLVNIYADDVIIGGYYDYAMDFIENPNINQTGYIAVKGSTNYVDNVKGLSVLFFDKNKTFIGGIPSTSMKSYFTTPSNCSYIRMGCTVDKWETFQIEEGTESTEFEPYCFVINPEYIADKTLNGIRFTSYGDSITERGGWQRFITSKLGLVHTNLGTGSTTMQYVPEYESEKPCMINEGRIQAIKDSNPDVITILAGANDAVRGQNIGTADEIEKSLSEKNKASYYGAYSYLIETLLSWKPNLIIILLTCTRTNVEEYRSFYEQCSEAVRTLGAYYSIPVVDLEKECGFNKFTFATYTTDGVHPNEEGCKKIASLVAAKMEDIYCIK